MYCDYQVLGQGITWGFPASFSVSILPCRVQGAQGHEIYSNTSIPNQRPFLGCQIRPAYPAQFLEFAIAEAFTPCSRNGS